MSKSKPAPKSKPAQADEPEAAASAPAPEAVEASAEDAKGEAAEVAEAAEGVAAPSAADVTAAADEAAAQVERKIDGIEITGPQSATITGTEQGIAAIIRQLREHGGQVTTGEHVLRGPITGRAQDIDGSMRITLAFPITSA